MELAFLRLERGEGTRQEHREAIWCRLSEERKPQPSSPPVPAQHRRALTRGPTGVPKKDGCRGWNACVTSLKEDRLALDRQPDGDGQQAVSSRHEVGPRPLKKGG